MICRILPHEIADGPANMGLDEALLDSVDADPTSVVLRTYEWSEPTLSLGYFQSIGMVEAESRWQGMPLVRRPSGGGALFHDRELTYALVVPRSHRLAGRPSLLYRAVHASIGDALQDAGIDAGRRGESMADAQAGKPFLCFLDHDPEDVLVAGSKVVGSAQRRRPSAVLQHGSVLLARSGKTPELPGLLELSGKSLQPASVADRLGKALSALLGLEFREDVIPRNVRERADELADQVYRNPSWTWRR